jgi:hypothetical protein
LSKAWMSRPARAGYGLLPRRRSLWGEQQR